VPLKNFTFRWMWNVLSFIMPGFNDHPEVKGWLLMIKRLKMLDALEGVFFSKSGRL
jgi:hypothetical protein